MSAMRTETSCTLAPDELPKSTRSAKSSVLTEPGCKLVPKVSRYGQRETSFTSLRQGLGRQAQATRRYVEDSW